MVVKVMIFLANSISNIRLQEGEEVEEEGGGGGKSTPSPNLLRYIDESF
jgi:hypothetical protein